MTKIILLDIDGVLVHPGGYRAALRAAFNYFSSLMGLPHIDIPEEKITELEKRGISSEWDMVPLLLASLWTDILFHRPKLNPPADLFSASVEISQHINGYVPGELFIPEFALVPGQYPAESALQSGCFSSIPMELRKNILVGSRDVHYSHSTRLFQHYSLGSQRFSSTYEMPMEVETESFLLTYDRSNIDEAIRAKLRQPGTYLSAFTARPSAPPREITGSHLGYAPEAELALELVGLPDIPLIAFRKLQYLASQHGINPVVLLKPSPVQALAAITAAMTGDEWAALQSACDWYQTGRLNSVLTKLPQSFELIVVEDTLGGIRSTQSAGEILQKAGLDITIRPLGLASSSPAQSAFKQANVKYYENWNSLIIGINL
jgi:hypothetical protein